jgi:hypothetical protein
VNEAKPVVQAIADRDDYAGRLAAFAEQLDARPGGELSPGSNQRVPERSICLRQAEYLAERAVIRLRGEFAPDEARLEYPRVVHNEKVAAPQKTRQILEYMARCFAEPVAGRTAQAHEARTVALIGGGLRYQLIG